MCTPCEPGYFGTIDNSTSKNDCKQCLPGTYNKYYGSTKCYITPKGFYQDDHGTINNKPCSPGTYNSVEGSSSVNDCILCNKGKYQYLNGSIECNICDKGYYQDVFGETKCK